MLIYPYEALGQHEKPIIIHKLRTMKIGAEKEFLNLVETQGLDSFGKIINDPRIIFGGHFLRKYFIDEFPNFIDYYRGDLKLVGIRPKSRDYWKQYPEEHRKRALQYKPGVFGVHYFDLSLSQLENEINCLDQYEFENPFEVDKEFLRIILLNILFKGVRSH